MLRTIIILGTLIVMPGCVAVSRDEAPTGPVHVEAPSYARGSPYAPEAAYATSGTARGSDVATRPYDPYCVEAVGEAEAASAQALDSGRPRDAGRAERTARFAQRDCR